MLLTLLADAAGDRPDAPAVVTAHGVVTYHQWWTRSAAIAAALRARGVASFGCIVEDEPTLLALLAGAAGAGVEACAYPPAATPDEVAELAAALDHRVLVTDRADLGALADRTVVAPDDLQESTAPVPPPADAAPVLILTTGTTGRSKAARHDWTRLVRAVRADAVPPGSRWLLAYGLHRFAGVQVLLHVLVGQATLVVPPSHRPREALAFARDAGVTHLSATPTFWRFGLGLPGGTAGLDLEQVTLGGEAVPEALLEELRERFPRARISQVYASTEGGSVVSVTDGRSGLPVSVLERGADADVQLRIVDGELQVRSQVGMLGYRDAGDGDPVAADDGWRPTGDLVEVEGDRIVFVGRTTEVINVGGVKVHPLPIEALALTVPGVVAAHAHGRANPVAGQIVQLDLVLEGGADPDQVEDAVHEACAGLAPEARPRLVRIVDELTVRDQKVVRSPSSP